jgi:hypothetical protein
MRAMIAVAAFVVGLAGFAPFTGSAQVAGTPPVGTQAAPPPVAGSPQDPVAAATQDPSDPAPPPRKLQLSFDGKGNVTLIAQSVTLQEVLAEWTRLGNCYFPNADKLSREPLLPVQFENVPELRVLDSLLRSAAGVVMSPRTTRTTGASSFEVVQILAKSTATTSSSYAPPMNAYPAPIQTPGSPDDEIPPVTPVVNQAPPRANEPQVPGNRPPAPTAGVPGSGVFVPIQPVTPAPTTGTGSGTGRGGTTPPPSTTGRGGGGGSK